MFVLHPQAVPSEQTPKTTSYRITKGLCCLVLYCRLQEHESEQLKVQEQDLQQQHELLQMKYGFSDKVIASEAFIQQ